MKKTAKNLLQDSIFGALFTLWTAPVDGEKIKLPKEKTEKTINTWFLDNLIIGHRP